MQRLFTISLMFHIVYDKGSVRCMLYHTTLQLKGQQCGSWNLWRDTINPMHFMANFPNYYSAGVVKVVTKFTGCTEATKFLRPLFKSKKMILPWVKVKKTGRRLPLLRDGFPGDTNPRELLFVFSLYFGEETANFRLIISTTSG